MKRNPITKNGYDALRDELQHLKKVERPAIIHAIEVARDHGDLSENAEYSSAKEKQSFIETRIQELETKISTADIIDTSRIPEDRIVFGSTFVLCNVDTEEEITYKIVGADESDLNNGRISIDSPIARALIGKRLDDEVIVTTPKGKRTYEVLDISTD
ncbi:MAG: transcription elongation factor GreA [Thermodesulfobacteriota bacterium]|nr:transcription elongation factor GreA [Thermodesulfobacteriota bacterium]